MDSDFEPDVRTEETPEARIVIVDLPGYGFRREDLRVQINNRGNLILSGERRGKEIEEVPKVGGRLQKMQRQGHRFRKVIDVRENLKFDGITAKFKSEALRVYLPLVQILDQQNQAPPTLEVHGRGELHVVDQSVKSKDKRSNPVEQEDSSQEPEPSASAQKSTEMLEEKEPELLKEREPELPEAFFMEPPISNQTSAIFADPGSPPQSEAIQEKEDEDEGQTSGKAPESGDSTQENNLESSVNDRKPEEKNQLLLAKEGNEDGVGIVDNLQDNESCLK